MEWWKCAIQGDAEINTQKVRKILRPIAPSSLLFRQLIFTLLCMNRIRNSTILTS